jgi:uncharacterized protein
LKVGKIKNKGRAVFSTKRHRYGDLIESCPVVVFKTKSKDFASYAFEWSKTEIAIALGLGSLYNHSRTPNIAPVQDKRKKTVDFYAIKHIDPGEELTFKYSKQRLSFE